MPIKLKNIPVIEPSDPLQKHLNSILPPPNEKKEYARKKLQAACDARNLIKKNTDTPEKASKESDLQTAEAKEDSLTVLASTIGKITQINRENPQTLNEYLSEKANLRKENQLVYGKSSRDSNCCLGLGLVENQDKSKAPFYKRKLLSTHTHTYHKDKYTTLGAAEFGVTYDNKIFIVPKPEGSEANNLYKMAQGTLLKAVGCIQIGNTQLEENVEAGDVSQKIAGKVEYISTYNVYFDAPEDNIAVSLFALQQLGLDLSDTKVVIPNDNAPLINHLSGCNIAIHGEIKNASYYLDNEHRFKALAEKNLTLSDKVHEFFHTIDDEILKINKKLTKDIHAECEQLKLSIGQLLKIAVEIFKETNRSATKSVMPEQGCYLPNSSAESIDQTIGKTIQSENNIKQQAIFNDYRLKIKKSIDFFKGNRIDLSFVLTEVNLFLAFINLNSNTVKKEDLLKDSGITEDTTSSRSLDTGSESIPNFIEQVQEGVSAQMSEYRQFIPFCAQDPIKTCINLLRDYSKGRGLSGALKRFFSLAWNRHYVSSVNQFLTAYDRQELSDNLTVYDVFIQLRNYGAEISLLDNKSTLLNRLLFCAKLKGEESDFVPVEDFPCVLNSVIAVPSHPLVLRQQQDQVSTPIHITPQPTWVPPAIRTTPPPFKDSPKGSIELLINRTKPGSYQEPAENKFFHEQVRPRSVSVTSKKNLLSSKFFIDAEKGLNPSMLLEQRKEAGTSPCPLLQE